MKKMRGFTLIELLIVIAIIGILATIVLVSYNGAQGNANNATQLADLDNAANSLESYSTANHAYPITVAQLVTANIQATTASFGYTYCAAADGSSYSLVAQMFNNVPAAAYVWTSAGVKGQSTTALNPAYTTPASICSHLNAIYTVAAASTSFAN